MYELHRHKGHLLTLIFHSSCGEGGTGTETQTLLQTCPPHHPPPTSPNLGLLVSHKDQDLLAKSTSWGGARGRLGSRPKSGPSVLLSIKLSEKLLLLGEEVEMGTGRQQKGKKEKRGEKQPHTSSSARATGPAGQGAEARE